MEACKGREIMCESIGLGYILKRREGMGGKQEGGSPIMGQVFLSQNNLFTRNHLRLEIKLVLAGVQQNEREGGGGRQVRQFRVWRTTGRNSIVLMST